MSFLKQTKSAFSSSADSDSLLRGNNFIVQQLATF